MGGTELVPWYVDFGIQVAQKITTHSAAGPPNFISDIFYLTVAISHFGYLRTISNFEDLGKHVDELQRHLDMLQGDGSWMGVRIHIHTQAKASL